MQQLHAPAAKWFYLIGGFAIQNIMAERVEEYVEEDEEVVVEEEYDAISMPSREATPLPPPAPPAASELQLPEAPPVCTIHSTYAYITVSRERSAEPEGGEKGGQEGQAMPAVANM